MTRKERLEYCQFCLNRKFEANKGLVCKLTGEWADFEDSCGSYNIDETALRNQAIYNAERNQVNINDSPTFGLEKLGIKNGFAAGIILLTLGLGWLIGGLFYGVLFYYSFVLILFGLVSLIVSSINYFVKRKQYQKVKELESVIDNEY